MISTCIKNNYFLVFIIFIFTILERKKNYFVSLLNKILFIAHILFEIAFLQMEVIKEFKPFLLIKMLVHKKEHTKEVVISQNGYSLGRDSKLILF